jgi:hypothetical protein
LGIVCPALLVPPRGDAVTGQFARVMAGVQVDEGFVLPHIVKTMGNHRSRSCAAEVVVVGLDGFLGVDLAVTVEIAEQFLLLRIHADDGQASLQILLLEAVDLLELGVAVWIAGTHRLLLQGFPLAVPVLA